MTFGSRSKRRGRIRFATTRSNPNQAPSFEQKQPSAPEAPPAEVDFTSKDVWVGDLDIKPRWLDGTLKIFQIYMKPNQTISEIQN